MTHIRAFVAVTILSISAAASAQPAPQPPTDLTLRPAGAPIPALKYRFAADRAELVAGNAAAFYYRAILMIRETQASQAANAEPGPARRPYVEEEISKWIGCPLAEVPKDEARNRLAPFDSALREAELGALRRECDWLFEDRTEGIVLLIPEIQATRSIARMIALRVRLAVLEGKTDDAVHWLQVGLALARHVAEGPTIIQGLVGVAIMSSLARPLQDLIEAPGTPSLYWALATLPRPWIDMAPALSWERAVLEREVPSIRDADGPAWSLERARQVGDELLRKLALAGDNNIFVLKGEGTAQAPTVDQLMPRLGLAALIARAYPGSRARLIAAGRPEAEVDTMPTLQVVLIDGYREVRRIGDENFKWLHLPYWQSYGRGDEAFPKTVEEKLSNPLVTLYWMLYPAMNSARVAQVRVDRQYAAFQAIEAIRLYAGTHGGELPPNLDAITDAPAPIDPATGKPFGYALQQGSAILSAPAIPGVPPVANVYTIHATLKPAR